MKDNITILEMKGITKRFSGVTALDNCELTLSKGEVHCLVGENGAGKSTLVKILCGIYQRDAGTVIFDGQEVSFANPKQAMNDGIFIVHQELNLIPHLSVAQNIFIGKETTENHKFFFSDKRLLNDSQKLFDSLKFKIDPGAKVSTLSVAEQQMVEVAKAVYNNVKILIMDEPTAPLTSSEIDQLFEIIRSLKAQGIAVIYISHRMEELSVIGDRITVMRDGKYIMTADLDAITVPEIISAMVGRSLEDFKKSYSCSEDSPTVLKVNSITGRKFKNVSFELKRGEILGLAGLVGAGRTEIARAIFGADPLYSGTVELNGAPIKIKTPKDAVSHRIGYLSEDRKSLGLGLSKSVKFNTTLSSLDELSNCFGMIKTKKEAQRAEEFVHLLSIKTPSLSQIVDGLSGGNQQKVIIAKWLLKNSDILIIDEPTRGIDVGAKAEIYSLMEQLAKEGKSIIMISSELPEILRMSDRVAVICEGQLTGILSRKEANQEAILSLATNQVQ